MEKEAMHNKQEMLLVRRLKNKIERNHATVSDYEHYDSLLGKHGVCIKDELLKIGFRTFEEYLKKRNEFSRFMQRIKRKKGKKVLNKREYKTWFNLYQTEARALGYMLGAGGGLLFQYGLQKKPI